MSETTDNKQQNEHIVTLRTENLVKRYGRRTVVNGVSINVKQGRDSRSARSQRRRQDNVVLHDDGTRRAQRGQGVHRRQGR